MAVDLKVSVRSEIQIAFYVQISASGLLNLLGDEAFVLVEINGTDDHHDGDHQRHNQNNTNLQDCAKAHFLFLRKVLCPPEGQTG